MNNNIGNTDTQKTLSKLLTVNDVKEMLSIGRDRAYKLFQLEDFPKVRINKQYFIMEADLIAWFEENKYKTVLV